MRLLFALALATSVVAGCGDEGGGTPPPARTGEAVPALTVRVSELETRIAEYCEERSSGSASAADDERAAAAAGELIRLARRDPEAELGGQATRTLRDVLADVLTVLRADCAHPPLERRVARALAALR